MRVALVLSFVALAAGPARAEIDVRAGGGRVDIHVKAAPLAEILDRISRQTGMKVVYEGAPPRQLVTAALEGRTPAEAVLDILEGLGLNYAIVMDPTGRGVETLLMAGAAGPGTPPPPPSRAPIPEPPQARAQQAPEPEPEQEPEAEAEAEEDPADATPPEGGHPLPGGVPEIKEQNPPDKQGQPAVPGAQPGQLPPGVLGVPQQAFPASPFAPQAFVPPAPHVSPTPGPKDPNQPNEEGVEK